MFYWLLGTDCSRLYAQSESKMTDLPKLIPPSPNAAALGKYGDIPVGLYTGIPNIGIPLYTVKLGKFSLPISLNYHSSGLKVEERASNVGLGWSLNAGGVITRTVHGKPDESALGYWNYGNVVPADLRGHDLTQFLGGSYDSEPDMFYYNFGGKSGKFIIDATPEKKAHIIPFQDLSISHDNTLSRFEIVDENGIRYIFNTNEISHVDGGGGLITSHTSAWYLTQIITPFGTVDLGYSATDDLPEVIQYSSVDYLQAAGSYSACMPLDLSSAVSSTTYNGKVLTDITTPFENVHFYNTGNRLDLQGVSKVDSMVVSDYKGISKMKFGLSYSYFENNGNSFRLRLDRLTQYAVNDTGTLVHAFEYYAPTAVPAVTSLSQDYWGYFNGAQNTTLLPEIDPRLWGPLYSKPGANRKPDAAYAITGVLKKITYPAGGYTQFIYESNDYGFKEGRMITDRPEIAGVANTSASMTNTVNAPYNAKTFTIDHVQRISMTIGGNYSGAAPVENGPSVYVKRINTDGSKTVLYEQFMINATATRTLDITDTGTYEISAVVDGKVQNASIRVDYFALGQDTIKVVKGGGLRIKRIVNNDGITPVENIRNFYYRMEGDTARSSGNLISPYMFAEFKATNSGACTFLQRATFSTNYLGFTQGAPVGYSCVKEEVSGATSNGSVVSLFKNEAPNTRAALYAFDLTAPDGTPNIRANGLSNKASTDMDVFRGHLMTEKYYNNNGQLIRSVSNNYTIDRYGQGLPNYFEVKVIQPFSFQVCLKDCNICDPGNPNNPIGCHEFGIKNYSYAESRVISPWIVKTRTIETDYFPERNDSLQKEARYYYENPQHGLLTRMVTLQSTGDSLITVSKYPLDSINGLSASAAAAKSLLVSKHYAATLLQQSKLKNNSSLEDVLINYNVWPSGLPLPESVFSRTLNNPVENRLTFFNYDNTANILEQSKSNDVHEVYLWGYKRQYPVAKIAGGDYNTIISNVDSNVLDNPANDEALRNEIDKIRKAPGNEKILVSTYTYSPVWGLTSETDPAGKVTFYEYDGFGRLKLIRDLNGKILKQFDYRYLQPVGQ
ncbi:RHS repeat domain-containing protein [Chitinophaga sp. 22536]|uniref:RHS repeat domain-containing protein n=1 Tax=unclassified Chitinophaga TaxID=2619133 RepID=UPI003F863B1B